ncbi:hypothetical protein [Streptomyces misionensis]
MTRDTHGPGRLTRWAYLYPAAHSRQPAPPPSWSPPRNGRRRRPARVRGSRRRPRTDRTHIGPALCVAVAAGADTAASAGTALRLPAAVAVLGLVPSALLPGKRKDRG